MAQSTCFEPKIITKQNFEMGRKKKEEKNSYRGAPLFKEKLEGGDNELSRSAIHT